MLSGLTIKNFAIVESQTLSFTSGLTVLTGETGAGKSILIDALSLCLGARADRGLVRNEAERLDTGADFDLSDLAVASKWLDDQMLDSDQQCLLRRVISPDGRSRAFINGSPATAQQLQELGDLLVDIHAQNAQQSLMRGNEQRRLLDGFGKLQKAVTAASNTWHEWQQAAKRLADVQSNANAMNERRDLLSFQTQEMDALSLADGEFNQLTEAHARLSNVQKLQTDGWASLEMLDGDNGQSTRGQLTHVVTTLQSLSELDPAVSPIAEMLENAAIQVSEAATELRHYCDKLEDDPQERDRVEQRLDEAHRLARKHQCRPETLPALQERLAAELAELNDGEEDIDALTAKTELAQSNYQEAANKLSAGRQKAAKKLGSQVTKQLGELGMPAAVFSIGLAEIDGGSANGNETPQFMFQANPGQAAGPMHKVASGGELSRLSLAIRVATLAGVQVPTLVFDEVDAGIGGKVAEQVGRLLRKLAEDRQVLCITHLPQVAVYGHQHLRVDKSTDGKNTSTVLTELGNDARHEEIARMLGGLEITAQTQAHAAEMLERAAAQ